MCRGNAALTPDAIEHIAVGHARGREYDVAPRECVEFVFPVQVVDPQSVGTGPLVIGPKHETGLHLAADTTQRGRS